MSKATRNRARSARERIAAQQAAAKRAEQRRRLLIVAGSVGLVIVIVVAFIVIKGLSKSPKTLGTRHLPVAVTHNITNVPLSTLLAVNTGGISPSPVGQTLKAVTDRPLTLAGKPEMLYIGAEYCPYCAAMRWPMAVALSRFGTFGPLTGIHSTSTDVYPNTPTLTFYQQRYTSPYLTFTPVEHQKVDGKALQPVSRAQYALWAKFDTSSNGLGYPFVDFGNKAVITGPFFVPTMLKGLSWAQVASRLHNPSDPVARNVLGSANYITAAICRMTGNKPASVCTAAPIPAIEARI